MNQKIKEKAVRLLLLVIGLIIAHLGVTMFLLTNLGADPFNVMIQGLSGKLPISHGITHMGICFIIILILLITDRSYIKIGTIVCMVLGGPIIDGFTFLLKNIINGDRPFVVRLLIVVLACVILAFGMTIVITSEAGTGPNDLVAVVISDKLKKSFGIVRIIVDVTFFLIGVLLGGVFGIGTLVCAFVVGTAAGIIMPFSKSIVDWGLNLLCPKKCDKPAEKSDET
ncbi:MAG: hypothetical protein Q4D54_07880 [Eubacteriales bacterium]|nr:hypothetical protein [Eubacteriales bacterium]